MRIKSRANPIRLLTFLTLLLTLSISTLFATGDYNGTGEDVGGGSGLGNVVIDHNWSNPPKGYRFYAAKENGTIVSDVIDLWFGDGTAKYVLNETIGESGKSPKDRWNTYWNTARAVSLESSVWSGMTCEELLNPNGDNQIPEPFQGFSQGGTALESWIYATPDGAEGCNGLVLIDELFGGGILEEYINGEEEMYIIIESLTMFDILDMRTNEVIGTYAGSVYGWGYWQTALAPPQTHGNSYLRRGTNGVFAISLMLEETWEGTNRFNNMKVPVQRTVGGSASAGTWISAEQMIAYGYGTHEYRFSSLMTQMTHTWDYPLGNTPGPAPKVEEDLEDKVGIVKVYCTKDPETNTVISWDGSYFRDNNPRTIVVEDEEDYKVEEWYTSKVRGTSAPGTWPATKGVYPGSVQGPSGGPGTVILDPDKPTFERTLCVLLVKYPEEEELESELIIEESEISIYRKLSEVRDFNLSDTKIKWLTVGITNQYCDYQEYKGSHDCGDPECTNCPHADYDDCGETTVVTVNTNLRFKVKNEYLSSFAHILATKGSFKPEVDPKEGRTDTKSGIGPQAKEKEFDYKFVAYRGKNDSGVKDNLTLANYKIAKEKLSFSNSPVQSLDKSTGNKPVGKRWAQDEQASIEEEVTLKIKLIEDEAGADYKWSGRLKCGHKSEIWKRFQTAENILAEAPVTIHSYSGRPKTASTISGIPQSKVKDCYKGNGYVIPNDDLTISFYPYIRMTYETIGSNDKHDANVLSQHKRTLTVSDYAEAGYMNGGQTLVLRSQQWSIHQMAVTPTDERPWAQQNTVLPGGAIYNVSNKAGAGNTIILRTFQYISDYDSSLLTVMNAAGSKGLANHTRSKAEAEHQKFVASGLAAINNGYYIEQVINDDPMATFESLDGTGWNPVNSGDPGLSTEKKYYLYTVTPAGNKVQSSLIQATASGAKPTEYTVWSDTEGTIYLNGKAILSKGQSVKELKDTEAKYIDTRTKLITNYVGAIERNTGDDFTASWATDDGKWYNEAFSLTVLELETKITVGLQDTKKRETVLDPKLCPKNMGKSDYFSKAISSAYRLNPTSIKAEELGKGSGYVGTFREQDINIANISGLLRSNVFRIPNVNVQDLKD